MCKYCDRNGQDEVFGKPLLERTIELGCDIRYQTMLIGNNDNTKVALFTDVVADCSAVLFEDSIYINYCPMCGRKLNKELED